MSDIFSRIMSTNLNDEKQLSSMKINEHRVCSDLSKTDLTFMFSLADVSKNSKPRRKKDKEKSVELCSSGDHSE